MPHFLRFPSSRVPRWLYWTTVIALLAALGLAVLAAWALRPERLTRLVSDGLTRHLNLDANVAEINISLLPKPRISGRDLTVRVPNRPDLPPFISITRFSVDAGLFAVLRKHVGTVHADGLKIAVPPSGSRGSLRGEDHADDGASDRPNIIVDHFITHDAELTFVPRNPDRTPLVFAIHELSVRNVGFGGSMPFEARLTNPIPTGLVTTTGTFGPWNADDATQTTLSGKYNFVDADLATINGIGGTLDSTGDFTGNLEAIRVEGLANVPDFSLDLGGKPLPLTSNFIAVVNGTDGTTELEDVDAVLVTTPLNVRGAIRNLPGPGNRHVELTVNVPDGRVEDLLALALDSPTPIMVGDMRLNATLTLPPGKERLRNRLALSGTFGLLDTRFTSSMVQTKLGELSRRSQGKKKDDPVERVLSDLAGTFAVGKSRVTLRGITFEVPGATVRLNGNYALASEALDFRGTLSMKASVSQAVGGFKSIFLKPFDGLFRRNGHGAVLPIRITGTREKPEFKLEVGRVFKRD
jgi:hypothetical protein